MVRTSLQQTVRPSANARSMWHMSASTSSSLLKHQPHLNPCSCGCLLHTEGDKQLAEFLKSEITQEKANSQGSQILPSLEGFNVLASGNDISLAKQSGNETVKIVWNVGLAGMEEEYEDDEHGDAPPAPIAMPPNLIVMLNKGTGSTLVVHCTPNPSGQDQQVEEGEEQEPLSIIDAALMPSDACTGDYVDLDQKLIKTYKVAGNDMDETMYYMLVGIMAERGLTQAFVDSLLAMHTQYEHSQYIQFLERLRDFSSK